MSSYKQLLKAIPRDRSTTYSSHKKHRSHSCIRKHIHSFTHFHADLICSYTASLDESSHNVTGYMEAIHGCNCTKSQEMIVTTHSRLTAMLNIVRKLLVSSLPLFHTHSNLSTCRPLERDANDVKQLAHHLLQFPSLLPIKATPAVLMGVTARCLLESIPKAGFSCESYNNQKNSFR